MIATKSLKVILLWLEIILVVSTMTGINEIQSEITKTLNSHCDVISSEEFQETHSHYNFTQIDLRTFQDSVSLNNRVITLKMFKSINDLTYLHNIYRHHNEISKSKEIHLALNLFTRC